MWTNQKKIDQIRILWSKLGASVNDINPVWISQVLLINHDNLLLLSKQIINLEDKNREEIDHTNPTLIIY